MGAFSRSYLQDRSSVPFPSEVIGATENLRLSLISDQPGIVEFMGSPNVVISLHVGPSLACGAVFLELPFQPRRQAPHRRDRRLVPRLQGPLPRHATEPSM